MPILRLVRHVVSDGEPDAFPEGRELKIGELGAEGRVRHTFTVLSVSFRSVKNHLSILELISDTLSKLSNSVLFFRKERQGVVAIFRCRRQLIIKNGPEEEAG